MTAPEVEIRLAWRALFGPHRELAVERWLARHAEPHRRYHTATHVMWVLRHVDHLVAAEQVAEPLARVARAAALFHDVVYDPRRDDNEARSAEVAARELHDAGWAADDAAAVGALVEATAAHDPTCPLPGATVLFDADLAILGSAPAEYTASVTAIRAEYAHVDEPGWRVGRVAVLQRFLDREPLYLTATMRADREARAKANLTAELAALRG
jgi:predicted metal-dependent HD superfamily phosphohydrolase